MSRRFAENTVVPVERSRAEIERLVSKHGASHFASGWGDAGAFIDFRMSEREVRFFLPLPKRDDRAFTHWRQASYSDWRARSPDEAQKRWEQACRQSWRALGLVIKAKLEAVQAGITSFEEEFLSHIVLPDSGKTIGQVILPQIARVYGGDGGALAITDARAEAPA